MFSFFFLTQAHFFISTIYKLREDYLSTSLRVSGSDQWHLITASPDPSGHLQPSRSLVLCRIFYCPICHEAQRSVRSASFSEDKKKKKKHNFTLHCAIYTRDLSSVHPISVHRSCFLLSFSWLLLIAAKSHWSFTNRTHPFSKLGFSPGRQSPWNWTLQRGRSSCWTVHAANCTKEWHNNAHFLSACHRHTQQRLNPQWGGRVVLGIWHNTK